MDEARINVSALFAVETFTYKFESMQFFSTENEINLEMARYITL